MNAIDPGRLNQRVRIETRQSVQDDFGQASINWVELLTTWAEVLPLRGREFFAAAQVQQEHSIKVRLRYRPGIDAGMRLVWNGRAHDITGVIALEGGREWLEIMALAGVKDGR